MPTPRTIDLSKNEILAALTAEGSKRLLPHLQPKTLILSDVLYKAGDPAHYLYFPLDSIISVLASMEDGRAVEVSLVGPEGLVGLWAALGAKTYSHEAVVQGAGPCLRIKANIFQTECKRDGPLRDRVDRYTRYLLVQIAQTAACNRIHVLEKRLARWLLMTHDRAKTQEFEATHEFLAHMLGSDRSEVTLAAGMLRDAGLITYRRGIIKILNRKGLESAACECYQIVLKELNDPR